MANLEEENYILNRINSEGKKTLPAYLFWFFLGGIGAHRFYLGRTGSAVGLLLVSLLVSWWTFLIPTLIWIIVDAFLIPGMVKEENAKLENQIRQELNLNKRSRSHIYETV